MRNVSSRLVCDTPFDTSVFVSSIVIIISTIMAPCCCEGVSVRIACRAGRMIYRSCFSCWAADVFNLWSDLSWVLRYDEPTADSWCGRLLLMCLCVQPHSKTQFPVVCRPKFSWRSKLFDLLNAAKIMWKVNNMANSLFISVKEAPQFVTSTLIRNPFQAHHSVCVCFRNRGEGYLSVCVTLIIS